MTDKLTTPKLAQASVGIRTYGGFTNWQPEDVDKLETYDIDKYESVVQECRFFYTVDPIAGTVINKLIEIGIANIDIDQGQLSDNEYRVFVGIKPKLLKFMEDCALEYLISGLVAPEIKYTSATKEELNSMGVKKYSALTLPTDMWVRDPLTIKINSPLMFNRQSYFIKVSEDLYFFIMNQGKYSDGSKDTVLYDYLVNTYPEFVNYVRAGNKLVPYYNNLIIRRKVTTQSQYPIPYLYPALEALKHKRNIRRMDYSIAARVIGAIMLIKQGSDEYPVVEEDGVDPFQGLREQMSWRNTSGRDVERIFQLFANHTTDISWVFPPMEALLDSTKYNEVNQDIFFALGFPKILTTGETEKSNTSDPEMAMISPVKTMEKIQRDLLPILKDIVEKISTYNNFKSTPEIRFSKVSLYSVSELLQILSSLYNSGNLSRETYTNAFGYSFGEEVQKRSDEEKKLVDLGVPAFSPQPFSPQPGNTSQETNVNNTKGQKKAPEDKNTGDKTKNNVK